MYTPFRLKHIHEDSQLRKKYVECESKFKEIEIENKKFTVQMLNQCKKGGGYHIFE